ncbi:hypothetical protein D1872_273470 [compost metagenome]
MIPGIERHIARLVAFWIINKLLQPAYPIDHHIGYPVQMINPYKFRIDLFDRKLKKLGEPLLKTDR